MRTPQFLQSRHLYWWAYCLNRQGEFDVQRYSSLDELEKNAGNDLSDAFRYIRLRTKDDKMAKRRIEEHEQKRLGAFLGVEHE